MELQLVFLALAAMTSNTFAAGSAWDYANPASWGSKFSKCSGENQSPIDITTKDVEEDKKLGMFSKDTFGDVFGQLTFVNNGHALQVNIDLGGYTISDKTLFDHDYTLAQFHFHWGSTAISGGSEHTVDGQRYFGEMHLVHYNREYGSLSNAVAQENGLAVLGVFIDATYPQDNLAFNRVLNWLYALGDAEASVTVIQDLFSMETLLPCDMSVYYRYQGSLTTPTCDETVTWTVFKEPLRISVKQAEKLAQGLNTATLVTPRATMNNNFRPVQPLNKRKVTKPLPFKQSKDNKSLLNIIALMALRQDEPTETMEGHIPHVYYPENMPHTP